MRVFVKMTVVSTVSLLLWAGEADAEQLWFEYYTTLSTQDTYNSRGLPLNDVCAIVQQDRANVHKFGRIDPGDTIDPYFTTPDRRAMITGRCVYARDWHTVERIRNQVIGYVRVQVFGLGGSVTRVQIYEAAG